MNSHITRNTLIDYQFDLLDEQKTLAVKAHLDQCSVCRQRLDILIAKFTALDCLKEDITAPEQLLSGVITKVSKDTKSRVFSLPRFPAWVYAATAAAAVLLAAVVWNYIPVNEKNALPPSLVDSRMPSAGGYDTKEGNIPERRSDGVAVTAPVKADNSVTIVKDDFNNLLSQPPFPPASAIELNVLPRRDNVQLTIYNQADLTLVKEERRLTMKPGWNWLQFMWANTLIDPTSLELEPLRFRAEVQVRELTFPPHLKDIGRWLIASRVSGEVPFSLKNFTAGLSWQAVYSGTLAPDEKTMRLDSYVRVANNSGEDYENAQVRLVVGKIHLLEQIAELARRKNPYGSPHPELPHNTPAVAYSIDAIGLDLGEVNGPVSGEWGWDDRVDLKQIVKEGLSEYFLYSIEGSESIPNGWSKRLPSFSAESIIVSNLYKYDEERWGQQTVRFLSFKNDKNHNLGETPIPQGRISIFRQVDAAHRLGYVGGSSFDYIPVDEDVELNLGSARYVIVEPKLMKTETRNYDFDVKGNITGWDEILTCQVKVTNARNLPVNLEITRAIDGTKWDIESSGRAEYAKHDMTHARFILTMPPETKETFTYTTTIYRGTRSD